MQNYIVNLQSDVFKTFRCQKAANSLDIDIEKKSKHTFKVSADLKTQYNVGLIVGASGSGKTTLCKSIFGDDCFKDLLKNELPVIDQFPENYSYEECSTMLAGVGLTAVPCWIRPAYTLSNGQRARAEAALQMASLNRDVTIIDEWTSVVDRTVAKAMSHCIQKYSRKKNKKIVLCSCHYDVIEWLNPDWVIDCNKQEYEDRRSMVGTFERTDQLRLDIREVSYKTWPYFSKYHYLSDKLPGGKKYCYGLFNGQDQIGFQCFAAYIIGNHDTFFSNRNVIHPDYCGLGLGIKLINEASKDMVRKGFKIRSKSSSMPIYKSKMKDPLWQLEKTSIDYKVQKMGIIKNVTPEAVKRRAKSQRNKVKVFHWKFIWTKKNEITI